ncbi:MAG TPA: hypothetical protein VGK96_28430 [Candidatus Sulfotelmatobacter sp.]
MKRLIFLLLALTAPAFAQNFRYNGLCTQGATKALVSGLASTNYQESAVPGCTVTVYNTGTVTLSTIFSTAGGGALTNPFTGDTKTALFGFFASGNVCYDVVMSGQGMTPTTIPNICIGGGGGGGGGDVLLNPTSDQIINQPTGTTFGVVGGTQVGFIAPVLVLTGTLFLSPGPPVTSDLVINDGRTNANSFISVSTQANNQNITITLPPTVQGYYSIQRGLADGHTVTILPSAMGITISGQSSYVLNNDYESVTLNGPLNGNWGVVATYNSSTSGGGFPCALTTNCQTGILQGISNTDLFISGGGNNGIANAQANCSLTMCTLETPPTSGDTEQGNMLPMTANNVSSFLADKRANSDGQFATNVMPSSFTGYQFQTTHPHGSAFLFPNPGPLQGGEQVPDYQFNIWAAGSHNFGTTETTGGQVALTAVSRTGNVATVTTATPLLAQVGLPIVVAGVTDSSFNTANSPVTAISGNSISYSNSGANTSSSGGTATTHTSSFGWSLAQFQDITNYFVSEGIKGSTTQTFMLGIGDQIRHYYYTYCNGGWLVFSDEGCYDEGHHFRSPIALLGPITSVTDSYHLIAPSTQSGGIAGIGQIGIDVSKPIVDLQLMAHSFDGGDSHSPSPYIPTIVFDFPTLPITSITSSGGTAVATFTPPPGLTFQNPTPGGQVNIAGVSNSVFNGTFTILASTGTTLTYALAGSATSSGGTATEAIPVSYAIGYLVTTADVPTQDGTVTSVSFTVHSNTSPFTVSGGSAPDGVGRLCLGATSGNQMAFGVQVTAITAPDGSGNQVVTALLNRTVPASGTATIAAQGGACGTAISLNADSTTVQGLALGSLEPVLVSGSDNSVGVAVYAAGQQWRGGPQNGSQAFTEASFTGVPGEGNAGGTYLANNVQRVGGVLTLQINTNAGPQADRIILQNHIRIIGCPDATVNGEQPHPFTSSTDGVYSLVQSGADTSCADGTTSVRLPFNYLAASLFPAVEIYNTADQTPGVQPVGILNSGHMATSYLSPLFQAGDNFYAGPNSSLKAIENRMSMELITPGAEAQEALEINLSNYSASSSVALKVFNNMFDQFHVIGAGGVMNPPVGVELAGNEPYSGGFVMDSAPVHNGCALCIGNISGSSPQPGLQNFFIFSLASGNFGLKWNNVSVQYDWVNGNNSLISLNTVENDFHIPISVPEEIFTASSFLGGFTNVQTYAIRDISPGQPTGTLGYDNYLGVGTPQVTVIGTPGTSEYIYQLQANFPDGSTWTKTTDIRNGNATLSGTNLNRVSCSLLPTGITGEIWTFVGNQSYDLGPCASNASHVDDIGTRTSPLTGVSPFSVAGPWIAGADIVNGAGRGFRFTQNDTFAVNSIPLLTSGFSQHTDGIISADGSTSGDGLAQLYASKIGPTATVFWTTGASAPTGSCANGSLFSNTAGTTGSTFYVCVAGAWVNDK